MLSGMLRLVAGVALSDDIVAGGHKRGKKYTHMHTRTHSPSSSWPYGALKEFNKEAHLTNPFKLCFSPVTHIPHPFPSSHSDISSY